MRICNFLLKKFNSTSSENADKMFSSFYKNLPMSQGGERENLNSGIVNLIQIFYLDLNDDIMSQNQFSPSLNGEEITAAFLDELVNKPNLLPITDGGLMISKFVRI